MHASNSDIPGVQESDIATIDIVAESPGFLGKILVRPLRLPLVELASPAHSHLQIPDGTRDVPVEKIIATVASSQEELARMLGSSRQARSTSPTPSLRGLAPRPSSPAPTQRLTAAMDHRPAVTKHLYTTRGMATTRPTHVSIGEDNSGAILRRKILANMAQTSPSSKKTVQKPNDYFNGLL